MSAEFTNPGGMWSPFEELDRAIDAGEISRTQALFVASTQINSSDLTPMVRVALLTAGRGPLAKRVGGAYLHTVQLAHGKSAISIGVTDDEPLDDEEVQTICRAIEGVLGMAGMELEMCGDHFHCVPKGTARKEEPERQASIWPPPQGPRVDDPKIDAAVSAFRATLDQILGPDADGSDDGRSPWT